MPKLVKRIKNDKGIVKEMSLPLGTRPPKGWSIVVEFNTSDLDSYQRSGSTRHQPIVVRKE